MARPCPDRRGQSLPDSAGTTRPVGTLVEKAGPDRHRRRQRFGAGGDRVVTVTGVAAETARSKVVAVADDLRMDGKRITMG